ncbi:hypothetical protein ACH4LN_00010 [Streptomyces albus]|uniref:Uncharacterized protein n=1 Tax=Streptomyces albus TaxID=1888 RepID=A0A6C1CBS0_9ACTN|nr:MULTISPECIES: hypothetical protein [Streptomyces]QID39779.1 hypothetical protein G3260_006714 [Streptomyces albus]TGG86519.1 hypothetical protein D8771_09310 [Streptomyces albus]UVN53122.1 hypothetical protein NR995_00360 [Streptomyces albus]
MNADTEGYPSATPYDEFHLKVHTQFTPASPDSDSQTPSGPAAVRCAITLPDEMWWRSVAVHESAHALLGWTLGIPVERLTVGEQRSRVYGGMTTLRGGKNAQLYAVALSSEAAVAQADWLAAQGYLHPELRECIEQLGSVGDQETVDRLARDGFIVDRDRADSDARTILALPQVSSAVRSLAAVLFTRRALEQDEVASVLREHHLDRTALPPVWLPGLTPADASDSAPVSEATRPRPEPTDTDESPVPAVPSHLREAAERIVAESKRRAGQMPPGIASRPQGPAQPHPPAPGTPRHGLRR